VGEVQSKLLTRKNSGTNLAGGRRYKNQNAHIVVIVKIV
jgi:hypothetical protein